MDDAQDETYGILGDLLDLVSDNYNQVNILEEKANKQLSDILDKKIAHLGTLRDQITIDNFINKTSMNQCLFI